METDSKLQIKFNHDMKINLSSNISMTVKTNSLNAM